MTEPTDMEAYEWLQRTVLELGLVIVAGNPHRGELTVRIPPVRHE
jgi:hypothetical protein